MLSQLFDKTITIRRRNVNASQNSLGEFNYGDFSTWTAIYTDVLARIEQKESVNKTDYNEPGQRFNSQTKIYVESTTLAQLEDAVYEGSTYLGQVIGVYRAFGPNNSTSHYELDIELK